MKLLRGLLMSLVGAIILLHTLLPHEHFDSASEVESLHSHQCTANIFRDIQISFGLDHGFGHFEHFVKHGQIDNLFIAPSSAIIINPPLVHITSGTLYSGSLLIGKVHSEPQRGPPSC